YILKDSPLSRIDAIIIASGSEVHLALQIRDFLMKEAKGIRIISMPSLELFEKQSKEYKDELLIKGVKTIVLEFSNDTKWLNYIYNDKYLLNVRDFSVSGNRDEVQSYFGLDINSLNKKIIELIK
ncbi:transketolase, partial [bacterium]|nr:transketolase [bacterium]